jgi:hypothetical protein
MTKEPSVKLGQTLLCLHCGAEFVCGHPRQRFCTKPCARRSKENRPVRRAKNAERHRAWSEKNSSRLKLKRQERYRDNRDDLTQKQNAYLASLPKAIRDDRRRRYNENYEERRNKRYHQTRAWLPWLNSLNNSRARAKKRGISFTLTKEWALARWTGRCEVTGIEFVLSDARNPYLFSPSIDRIIPSLGYTESNSRFVIHAVNALKGAGTDDDMVLIAAAIVRNFQKLVSQYYQELPPIPKTHAPLDDLAETRS